MRILSALFCAFFVCAPLGGQTGEDDAYSMNFVKTTLHIASVMPGAKNSADVKTFQRLGDGVSIALLKILDERDLVDPKTVQTFLPLIRESFSYPPIIALGVNKQPKVTVFLLKYLDQNVFDTQTRREVRDTIQYVEHQVASPGTAVNPGV